MATVIYFWENSALARTFIISRVIKILERLLYFLLCLRFVLSLEVIKWFVSNKNHF